MALRSTYGGPDYRSAERQLLAVMENTAMGAATEWVDGFREEMRDQVQSAGLGPKLANTWRGKVYPLSGKSANAGGIVYVNPGRDRQGSAPRIMNFFSAGIVVRPLVGRFLAIPTDDVPKSRGGRPMSVSETEARFGRRLQFIDPADKGFRTPSIRRGGVAFLVLKQLTISRSGRWRNASKRELAGGRRQLNAVIMFILVPQVAGQKKLSPEEVFRRWCAQYPALYEAHFALQSRGLDL